MRLPFVSAATYDWAIRHSERYADAAIQAEWALTKERARCENLQVQVRELTDIIVGLKRENFVVDVPITSTALSVDEADEYAVADEEAKPGLLKRKLGS